MNRHIDFQEEIRFQVLRRLQDYPQISQRQLAKDLGISLGSINYCFKALMEKGWVKAKNFSSSNNKVGYAYLLTPAGFAEKSKLTASFLQRKLAEYDKLRQEIDDLRQEVEQRRT